MVLRRSGIQALQFVGFCVKDKPSIKENIFFCRVCHSRIGKRRMSIVRNVSTINESLDSLPGKSPTSYR